MPIRINLKELFDSDSQPITIDKVNFNFNKLLELGIGLPGDKGVTGPQGGVGPAGTQGPIGDDGNQWFVGSGNPNSQVFTGIEGRDFYLDTANSSIWQYDGNTETWSLIVDFASVITNYLNQFGITFIRGLGTGSPDDDRYIIFPNRGNTLSDQATDVLGGSSNNDILFLNNFNEKLGLVNISNFPTNTDNLYNAIQKIYTDNTPGIPGRYHLELGSLFADTNVSGDVILSDVKTNLKFRYVVDDLGGASNFPLTNNYIYLGKISLSKPELSPLTDIDYNSALEIITPKYNNEGGPVTRSEQTFRIGSKEAIGEYFSGVNIDGFTIDTGSLSGKIAIGIARDFSSIRPQADGRDYLMLESDTSIDGIYLKGKTFQDGGNIELLSTGRVSQVFSQTDVNFIEAHWNNQGLAIAGNKLITLSGERSPGTLDSTARLSLYDLSNPISPINEYTRSVDSFVEKQDKTGMASEPTYNILGAGLADVQIAGEYAYFVNNQDGNTGPGVSPPAYSSKAQSTFQIGKIYNDNTVNIDSIKRISYLNVPELEGAYRLEVRGKWAWVICNSDRTPIGSRRGRLTLVDIANPELPVEYASYLDVIFTTNSGSRYIAMDASDNRVAVLRTKTAAPTLPGSFTVDLVTFDTVTSPTPPTPPSINFSASTNAATRIFTGSAFDGSLVPNTFGGLRILGKHAYVAWNDQLFIYDIQVTSSPLIIKVSEVNLGIANSPGSYAIDLEVVGTTAYILAYDGITDPSNPGTIIKMDVSDVNNPFIISITKLSGLAKPSRIKYSGKYLYVTCASDASTSQTGGLRIIDVDGIKSPGGQIDSLRTSILHVDRNAVVQENLSVNQSLNVGPGGIYIDKGEGLGVDGDIIISENGKLLIGATRGISPFGYHTFEVRDRDVVDNRPIARIAAGGVSPGPLRTSSISNGVGWLFVPRVTVGGYGLYDSDDGQTGDTLIGCTPGETMVLSSGGGAVTPYGSVLRLQGGDHPSGGARISTTSGFTSSKVYIGTNAPANSSTWGYQLELESGDAYKPSSALWLTVSDERIKENIELADLDICYNAIKNIPLKRFKWKDEIYSDQQISDRRKLGWIAQDVESVFPKAIKISELKYNHVYEEISIPAIPEELDEDGNVLSPSRPESKARGTLISCDTIDNLKTLDSDQLYAAMYGAVQKLIQKVESLESEIAILKGE